MPLAQTLSELRYKFAKILPESAIPTHEIALALQG